MKGNTLSTPVHWNSMFSLLKARFSKDRELGEPHPRLMGTQVPEYVPVCAPAQFGRAGMWPLYYACSSLLHSSRKSIQVFCLTYLVGVVYRPRISLPSKGYFQNSI